MSFILNIDTAVKTSSVCLAQNEKVIGLRIASSQKEGAAWIHVAIAELMHELNLHLHQLDAIAVSEGPGSYTGLRVGMATAKGLCYTLEKPLIVVNTLMMMAFSARNENVELLCPMIDARRMEVFAAIFDKALNTIQVPGNFILDEQSFSSELEKHTICFFGDGSDKFKQMVRHNNAVFKSIETTAVSMIFLSFDKFVKQNFADIAYSEPFYAKDFHSLL